MASPTKKAKTAMEVRQCGDSDLKVSVLGFGCWQMAQKGTDDYWAVEYTQDMANALVKQACDAGVTYFDTAEDYAAGESEKQLGNAVKSLDDSNRKSVVIGSKLLPNHCGPGDVEKYTQGTLDRLGIECIDLYMVHWPIDKNSMAHFASGAKIKGGGRDYAVSDQSITPDAPPTEAAFQALVKLQKAGKIKHIGVSNFGVEQLKEALATGVKIAVNQCCYNMIFRAIEFDIIPFCVEKGIGVFAYSPLMQGLLTGKYSKSDDVPIYRARTRHFDGSRPKSRHGEKGHEELLWKTVEKIREISKECGISMTDLAISYPLHTKGVACVIVGATKASQLDNNFKAVGTIIPAAVLDKLNAATEDLKQAMGKNADLWQGGSDGRIK